LLDKQQHLPFFRQALILAPGACSLSFKSRPYLSPRPCHNFVVHGTCGNQAVDHVTPLSRSSLSRVSQPHHISSS
jgi:hypothetical protein